MPDSEPTTHMLDVPGARLYYERRGSGPLLLLIGSPMDSSGFAPLASTALGYDRVLPDADVELLAITAWTSFRPAA